MDTKSMNIGTGRKPKLGRRTLIALGVAGALYGGFQIYNFLRQELEKPIPYRARSEFDNVDGTALQPFPNDFSTGRELFIKDVDNDKKADLIHMSGNVYWVAEGYWNTPDFYTKDALTMTPEIREVATRALEADRDLSFLLYDRARIFQENQKKGESK